MTPETPTPRLSAPRRWSKRVLIFADDAVHVAVAIMLVIAAAVIVGSTLGHFKELTSASMVHVINDALLALIIMEILWTIIRYLGKQPFSLNPFLFIGIIAAVRRILSIEAEISVSGETAGSAAAYAHTIDLAVAAGMVLVLATAYYIINKGRALGAEG